VRDIQLNIFHNKFDSQVKSQVTSWENLVKFFTSPHEVLEDKFDSPLFNGVRYKDIDQIPESSDDWDLDDITGKYFVRRRKINIVESDLFVIDYDGGVTLNDMLDRFKDYEFIYYTSYRHLYDGETEKFRLIFPFHKPIPSWVKNNEYGVCIDYGEWYQVIDSLKEFSGPCDPTSFIPNTMYHIPSTHESRVDLSKSGYNKGKLLNWEEFDLVSFEESENTSYTTQSVTGNKSERYLLPDQILETQKGNVVVSEITGVISGVKCPFHNDKKGTEFVRKVEVSGNIFLRCNTCVEKFYMRSKESVLHFNKKITNTKPPKDSKVCTFDELLEFDDDRRYFDSKDRVRVTKQLDEIKKSIETSRIDKSHILYLPEGSGKSHLVIQMATEGKRIIFCCKSWSQVESKYQEYERIGIKEGFRVQVVRSKDGKFRKRFDTKPIRVKQKYPFSSSKIDLESTINEIEKNNPSLSSEFVRICCELFDSDSLSFDSVSHPTVDEEGYSDEITKSITDPNTRIVLTTFEQLRIHKLKNNKIPNDWIVWIDDPDNNDVIDINPYHNSGWNELHEDDIEKKTKLIGDRRYFTRPCERSLGYSVMDRKVIYTTTEIITLQAIELMMKKRGEEYILHNKMDNLVGGKITVLGTDKVWKRFDGIIPLLTRRLSKKNYKTKLISDGLSSEINHSNNKGRNDLNITNLLVELSAPHPEQVKTLCDALEVEYKKVGNDLKRTIVLDQLHQAIGRNSGFRWKGYQCVALVDKGIHQSILENVRYKIDTDNSVLIDRTSKMSRKEKRTSENVTPIVEEVESFLNKTVEYVSDTRKVKPDIKFVLKSIKDTKKRNEYIVRLLVSLLSLSGIQLQDDYQKYNPENPIQEKYWEIIKWILDTQITDSPLITIQQVHIMVKEINGNPSKP